MCKAHEDNQSCINRHPALVSPRETIFGSTFETPPEKGVNLVRFGRVMARWKAEEPSFSNWQSAKVGSVPARMPTLPIKTIGLDA